MHWTNLGEEIDVQFISICILAAAGLIHPAAIDAAVPQTTTTEVVRQGEELLVELNLSSDAPEWVFRHSPAMLEDGIRWRARDWAVTTPGVELIQEGDQDILRSSDGSVLPRTIRLRVTPSPARVEASYNPVVDFGAGSFALYSGQFDVRPRNSDATSQTVRIVWRDSSGPILFNGERHAFAITTGEDAYILFGEAGVTEHDALATVLHDDLPGWISEMIRTEAPALIDHYVTRLGGGPAIRPTVMAGWNGPTPGMTSMGGSVLPGLIAVSFEGGGLAAPSDNARFMIRAFLAHESAHFWLGQTVTYASESDMWITEGGADLMSVRTATAVDPNFPADALIDTLVNDCRTLAAQGPVASAGRRGQPRAYYACGAVFALAAEGARSRQDGGDWLDVVADLIAANRDDGVVTREEWLGHFDTFAGDRARDIVEMLLDEGGPESSALIDELFVLTGVQRPGG